MPGRTPNEALRRFVDPLQLAVSCITKAIFTYFRPEDHSGSYPFLLSNDEDVPLKAPNERFFLCMSLKYTFVTAEGERGHWKVKTLAYAYEIRNAESKDLLAFHWHPDGGEIIYPHIHICHATGITHTTIRESHVPSGRVPAEAVIRYAIEALKVKPLRRDWDSLLSKTQRAFEQWKTW